MSVSTGYFAVLVIINYINSLTKRFSSELSEKCVVSIVLIYLHIYFLTLSPTPKLEVMANQNQYILPWAPSAHGISLWTEWRAI